MKIYQCPTCAGRIFFENLICLACGTELGYAPAENVMVALRSNHEGEAFQPCANRATLQCNWLVPVVQNKALAAEQAPESKESMGADDAIAVVMTSSPVLCDCCRYTQTIPPLDQAGNQQALRNLEQAKRYLFYSLYALKLPIPDRSQQPDTGLSFRFLAQLPDQPKVITGHASGVITINISEADDAKREQRRVALHESYRTVLGHLRHEIGHFYWDQLIANSDRLEAFRQLFGDERQDYAAALKQHYQGSAGTDWVGNFISYYASAHPWEDWAESWAHYLHISDALDTAEAWGAGLTTDGNLISPMRLTIELSDAEFRDRLITQWLPLSQYLNAACRSLGESDAYPFVLPPAVVNKLAFIHTLLSRQ